MTNAGDVEVFGTGSRHRWLISKNISKKTIITNNSLLYVPVLYVTIKALRYLDRWRFF